MQLLKLMLIGCLLFVSTAQAKTDKQPAENDQTFIPEGWVLAPDDASKNLSEYLSAEYQKARKNGKTAYAYIYSDNNSDCRRTRKNYNRKSFQKVFSDAHIVMLSFKSTKEAHQGRWRWGRTPRHSKPAIIKISDSGLLTRYDFHAQLEQSQRYPLGHDPSMSGYTRNAHPEIGSTHQVSTELRRFFRRYAED